MFKQTFESVLLPFSFAYGAAMRLRSFLYASNILQSYRSKFKVLSVGNISLGGNAKTPLTRLLCDRLIAKGFFPIVLTRGYGGYERGPLLMSIDSSVVAVERFGDESLMLARSGQKVIVARKRASGAQLAEKIFAEKDKVILILDDGHQHLALRRDLNIVNIAEDSQDHLVKNYPLPAGLLREWTADGLKRADALVFVRRAAEAWPEIDPALIKYAEAKPHFRARYGTPRIVTLEEFKNNQVSGGSQATALAEPIGCFTTFANPQGFLNDLTRFGMKLEKHIGLRDHALITPNLLAQLRHMASSLPIVCSEKDAVKLLRYDLRNVYVVLNGLEIENQEVLEELIVSKF